MTLVTAVSYLFAAAVTISCVQHLRKGGLKEDLIIFKGRTLKDWVEVVVGDLLAIGFVVGCFFSVDHAPKILQPVLNLNWLQFLATKGENAQGGNQMVAGVMIPYFGPIFFLLLLLNLPRLAAIEEEEFRLGTRDWWHAVPRSLAFGLMHMIVGVPLWLGLALAVPGMWFSGQYFRGGVSRSTMAHTVYNVMASSVLFWFIIAPQFSHTAHPK